MMKLSENDKKEILRLALEKAIVHKEIPDYGLIKDKNRIVILKENVEPERIPDFKDVKFYLLSYDEIQKKANKEGDFLYLRISDFEIKNRKVYIRVENVWIMSEKTKAKGIFYLSGGGIMLEFEKVYGKWNCKVIEKWIS